LNKFIKKIILNRALIISYLRKLVIDVVLFNFAIIVSVWVRFDFHLNLRYLHVDDPAGLIENLIFLTFMIIFRIPYQIWSYASLKELTEIIVVVTLTMVISSPIFYLFRPNILFSRGAYLTSFLLAIVFLTGARLIVRIFQEKRRKYNVDNNGEKKKTLIVGAGDAGEKILREILARPDLGYDVIGFLDDNPGKIGGKIHGFPVLGTLERIPFIVDDMGIDLVLFAIPSAPRRLLRKVTSLLATTAAEIKALPGIYELIDGRVYIDSIKKVDLEDLLPRASIKVNLELIKKYIKGKRVLITGAGGSIGSEITRQVVKFSPNSLILLGRGEYSLFSIEYELKNILGYNNHTVIVGDIRNRDKIFSIFDKYRPEIIFHAAAHKHVPLMERNPDEAVINNIFGTMNLLDACIGFGVERFVNISTDKAVNPTNIMGASKRVIEMMIQLYAKDDPHTIFTNVRFGNVLGSKGSVTEIFKKQIRDTGILTVTEPKMERYFMLIPEAVQLVFLAGIMGKGGENFVLKMGQRVNIWEFAKSFVKLSGFEVGKDIHIKVIGNRGREKIVEELWSEDEIVEPTENPYILIIKPKNSIISKEEFFNKLDELKHAAEELDFIKIKQLFTELIPEANL